jgi:hypothetical protein
MAGMPSARALLQLRDPWRHRQRLLEQLIPARKFEVVNHVDQQQSGIVRIRRAAVQIVLFTRLGVTLII